MAVAAPSVPGRAQSVVRRTIVFVILFALVTIAAIGLSGLLERAIGAGRVLVDDDAGLARSLAFALIGGPLAGLLWWWERRRLADASERASLVWALYLVAMTLTSLIVAAVALGAAATGGIEGEWRPGEVSVAVVWLAVWVWHRHLARSAATAPTRLIGVTDTLSAVFGLAVAVSGAIGAISTVIARALMGIGSVLVMSQDWGVSALQSLVWFAIGALIWWWHGVRAGAGRQDRAFADVVLVIIVGLSAAGTLFAIGTLLYVVLRVVFAAVPLGEALSPLDEALAAALIGGIVWQYHARVLTRRGERARLAGRLVISAVALVGAASGFGVVVNALLATWGDPLVGGDLRSLLLGGISALVVGGPAWWIAWRPARPVSAQEAAEPARRVYLIAIFGVSAIVAIVSILIIGYRLFEFGLDAGSASGLIERVRAPLGLLSATALVFGYHFAIWRRDRAAAGAIAPDRPAIGRLILVTGDDGAEAGAALRAEFGMPVTVWRAADATAAFGTADLPALRAALEGLSAPRVLVIAEPGGGAQVVPLAD
jgi:hypothetical protein